MGQVEIQCSICKGFDHIDTECANKLKNTENEKIAATWDDSFEDLDNEATSEDKSLQAVKIFTTFIEGQSNDLNSEDEKEDLQEAFNEINEESRALAKLKSQLKRENKELTKNLSLSEKSQNLPKDFEKERELLKNNTNLSRVDEELREKIKRVRVENFRTQTRKRKSKPKR